MSSYGNTPQDQGRQRPVERYAGEFLNEPSMSAPQPIPDVKGKRPTPARKAAHETPSATPTGQQMGGPGPAVRQDWSQPYAPPPGIHPDWSQQYAAQPGAQQGWSQQYAAQPGAQQGWPQQYAAQPGMQQGWSQQYPAQPSPPQTGATQPLPQQTPGSTGWPAGGDYVPPAPPPEKGGNGGGNGNWWKLALLAVVLVAVVVGAVCGGITLSQSNAEYEQVTAYNDRFCEGVYVDGIHLGGMTQAEAIAAVEAHAQEQMAAWSISLTYGGQLIRRITAQDLGMTVNVHDALAEAWEQGHGSSDVSERKAAMDALLENPYHGYTAMPSGDTSTINRILNELAAPVYRKPQNATVTFDPEAHAYPFEYTAEVYGTYLDVVPIKQQIYAMVDTMESGSIELTPQSIAPAVTEADLRAARSLRGSAKTVISTVSTEARTANIQRAFQLINGTVIKPGGTFSFNGVVGARSEKNGFYKAIEYAYGEEREGYGGGVCQASTTVYLAAVRSAMTITHREPHSDKVNYTEYGLDATVNLDGKKIDLTFKNTTSSDVYVMAYLVRENNRWVCKVDVYGEALPEGVTYDLVAETVEVLPAPVDPEYVKDETGTKVVYVDDPPVQKRAASDGYIVETFIVQYLNGAEVSRTYVARDTYKAKAQQFYVGVQEREW